MSLITVSSLSKSFGPTDIFSGVSFSVAKGARMAIVGPNGIGKSTFLKLVAGIIKPSDGLVDIGHEVYTGYCPQDHQDVVPPDTTPFEWLYALSPGETVSTIMGLLGRVLIRGDDAKKSTAALSGGETARLIFAGIMLQKPNLLLLDEPTNHMDIESLEALGRALHEYPGTVVCVSHDRRFIESFSTAILELKADGFDYYPGGYLDYLENQGEDYLDRTSTRMTQLQGPVRAEKTQDNRQWKENSKALNKLKRDLKKTESRIAELEEQIARLETRLSDESLYKTGNSIELQDLLNRKETLETTLELTYQDWEKNQATLDKMNIRAV